MRSFAICTLPCTDAMALVYACDIYGTSPLLNASACPAICMCPPVPTVTAPLIVLLWSWISVNTLYLYRSHFQRGYLPINRRRGEGRERVVWITWA